MSATAAVGIGPQLDTWNLSLGPLSAWRRVQGMGRV
jgi:hypothetical protein